MSGMTHCTAAKMTAVPSSGFAAKTNDKAMNTDCFCSGEAKYDSIPSSGALCCCADYCTCQPSKSCRHHKQSRNFSQQPLSPRHLSEDKLSQSRRCLYCLPEQMLIHEDDIVNRQQRCRATRASLLKKRRDLVDEFLLGSCTNSYRSNNAEMLRFSSSKFYQYELDREYKKRVLKLREELRSREREYARRNRLQHPQDVYSSDERSDQPSLNVCKDIPPPCPRCYLKGREFRRPKQGRLSRRCGEPPGCSPRPSSRVEFSNCQQRTLPLEQQNTRGVGADALSPRRWRDWFPRDCTKKKFSKGRQRHPSPPPQHGKATSTEDLWPEDKEKRCCPSCGHFLRRASAAEVVSMLARGKFDDFFQCDSCGLVAGKPSSDGDKTATQFPTTSTCIRRSRSASSAYSRSPFYGRRVFITDNSYLDFRSKLFSQWEKSEIIKRIPQTRRSLSISFSENTQKWRTLPSR